MGYSQMMAICSLINSSNDLNGAIMWINNFRQHLSILYPSVVVDVVSSHVFLMVDNSVICSVIVISLI